MRQGFGTFNSSAKVLRAKIFVQCIPDFVLVPKAFSLNLCLRPDLHCTTRGTWEVRVSLPAGLFQAWTGLFFASGLRSLYPKDDI